MTNVLIVNQFLRTGEYLVSPNGSFFAVQKNDGNFCVYKGKEPGQAKAENILWCSGQIREKGQYFTIQQGDGNLCVYRGTGPDDNQGYVWGTQVAPGAGQYLTILQDDGNLCVYKGTTSDIQGYAIWCSGVAESTLTRVKGIELIPRVESMIRASVLWSGGGSSKSYQLPPGSMLTLFWDPRGHGFPDNLQPGSEMWLCVRIEGSESSYETIPILYDRQSKDIAVYEFFGHGGGRTPFHLRGFRPV